MPNERLFPILSDLLTGTNLGLESELWIEARFLHVWRMDLLIYTARHAWVDAGHRSLLLP